MPLDRRSVLRKMCSFDRFAAVAVGSRHRYMQWKTQIGTGRQVPVTMRSSHCAQQQRGSDCLVFRRWLASGSSPAESRKAQSCRLPQNFAPLVPRVSSCQSAAVSPSQHGSDDRSSGVSANLLRRMKRRTRYHALPRCARIA